jgi:hypothetical protein
MSDTYDALGYRSVLRLAPSASLNVEYYQGRKNGARYEPD